MKTRSRAALTLVSTLRRGLPWAWPVLLLAVGGSARGQKVPQTERPVSVPPTIALLGPADAGAVAFLRVREARELFQATGAGLAVAVVSTGVNQRHAAFAEKLLPGRNFTAEGGPEDVDDQHGQGSHLAATIAGRAGTVGLGEGIAPQARIVPLKVMGEGGSTTYREINGALDWVLEHRRVQGTPIAVVLLPFGASGNLRTPDPARNDPGARRLQELIGQLRQRKIAVVAPAGNDYAATAPAQGMIFPAICPATISVGAVYDRDIPPQGDRPLVEFASGAVARFARAGRCVPFSQRLGAGADGKDPSRTDLFAPGFLITSAGPGTAPSPERCVAVQSGTDQAAAHVAGAVLLLQQRFRELTRDFGDPEDDLPAVDLIENCLRDGGVEFQDSEDEVGRAMDNVPSTGARFVRLDVLGALDSLQDRYIADVRRIHLLLLQGQKGGDGPTTKKAATTKKGEVEAKASPREVGGIPSGARILGKKIE